MLRDRRAAATTVVSVHQMTVAAPCAPQEGAAGQSSAATNSLRYGATIVLQPRVEKVSMDAAASQSPSDQPAAVQRASRVSRAKAGPRAAILEILTIYGAKTGLNPKTRDNEYAPPGPFCVGPTSRSDPTLGQCFYTTFGMHTVHFNSSGFFCLSSDAPPAALAAP